MITKLLGALIILSCLASVYLFETAANAPASAIGRILHWPAMFLTGLGPIGVVLLCSEWRRVRATARFALKKSPASRQKRLEQEADLLQALSARFYAQGAQAFDASTLQRLSGHNRRAIERLSLRMSISDVKAMLDRERDKVETAYSQALDVVGIGLRLSPSVGMLGTILGMVQLLSNLKDSTNIGSYMGVALLTTFYGLFFSIVCWTPLAQRLEALRDIELHAFDRTLHWLELLGARKPVQYFSESEALT